MTASVALKIDYTAQFNYTFFLNGFSFLRAIQLESLAETQENLKIHITSSLGLFTPHSVFIERLEEGHSIKLETFKLAIDQSFLKKLSEKDIDAIQVQVLQGEELLATETFQLTILPMDYFAGIGAYPQLLAAYVLSNHQQIYEIKTAAVKILEANRLTASFEGYQQANKERVVQVVSSLYKALQNLGLIYSALPPSFEQQGQRIRLLDKVLATKFGNCIDISLIVAAALEAINLNPILILTKGHAFIGLWLDDQRFDNLINTDRTAISKRLATGNKELIVFEATSLCRGSNLSFTQAMQEGERQMMEDANFILSIDIKAARAYGIQPMPQLQQVDINTLEEDFKLEEEQLADSYELGPNYPTLLTEETRELSKQKLWERKLLDLSLRNNLLNLRFTKGMLQIVDVKVHLLEDNLAEGKVFSIHPDSQQELLRKYNRSAEPLHTEHPRFKLAEEEFQYNRLLSYYHVDDLDTILTHLYRSAKLAEEENGRSTLYLGIGLLKWFEPRNKMQARQAPILLIPVELYRKSVHAKFSLRSREEDTLINITLLEYLKQEFKLNINHLEQLPMDEKGVDVTKVLATLRHAILNFEGWEVLEQTVLGIFSFNKLLLWQDISKYSEEIQRSPIVRSLMEGQLHGDLLETPQAHMDLELLSAQELTLPIPTDNSQLHAVKIANQNKTFILHGPPGTGKSQTITNIIADALANDKRVLFVAAKKAALDVVHKRLVQIGLGPFCLELHSNKAKKSDILTQFDQALQVPKYQMDIDVTAEALRLDQRREKLSAFVEALHRKNDISWSLYDTISFLENKEVAFDASLKLPLKVASISPSSWNEWNDWLLPFAAIVGKIGAPQQHPLRFVGLSSHKFDHTSRITESINVYLDAEKSASEVHKKYAVEKQFTAEFLTAFKLIEDHSIDRALFTFSLDGNRHLEFQQWLTLMENKQDLHKKLLQQFHASIFQADTNGLSYSWNQAEHSWFLAKWWKQRKVKSQLQGYAKQRLDDEMEISAFFQQMEAFRKVESQLQPLENEDFSRLSKRYMEGEYLNTGALQAANSALLELTKILQKVTPQGAKAWIENFLLPANFEQELPEISTLTEKMLVARENLSHFLTTIPDRDALVEIKEHINQLEDWINYQRYKEQAAALNLSWFIELLEKESVAVKQLPFEFEKIIRLNHFIESMDEDQVLQGFDAHIYESLIQQYRSLHQEYIAISSNQLLLKLSNKVPNANQEAIQSSEIGILQRAIRSKGRGLSIRKLFDQIPSLIPRLKPCMLMSPISVAQYFDVSSSHFDLVIFDEASQLPTAEAISSLARAKQAIIVGDPKQMPPTSFFSSTKMDEEEAEVEDLESILEDALALSIPSNYLLKHYRSKHESLISFSNKNFYDNKLMTFPSPDDLNRKVSFHAVKGFYDKGRSRTNKAEAEAVINYIKGHLASNNTKTLGVVTFSQTQQSLIEDLLQHLFRENGLLEEAANKLEEPIFIKNLENVQGDERDIILFSIGYGPDEDGKVSMNFGPLNREGGWRRLNVAITRARYEMRVYATLHADQIDLNRSNSEGIRALKGFLAFAEKGNLGPIDAESLPRKPSVIDAVATALEARGYSLVKEIGASEYKIDLGIVHPQNKEVYLLGILLDSVNYYQMHTTNDRELLTPQVLKGLGWQIVRIWTLDWLKNKEQVLSRIDAVVADLLKNNLAPQPAATVAEIEDVKPFMTAISASAVESKIKPYQVAEIKAPAFANSEHIYFPENRRVILQQMQALITVEGPISKSLLFRKIIRLWNTSRAGAKLTEYLSQLLTEIPNILETTDLQPFYWDASAGPQALNCYRDNSLEGRAIEDFAAQEIGVLMQEIIYTHVSLAREDLIRLTAKSLNFSKVGSQIDAVLSHALTRLLQEGKVLTSNDKLILPA